MKKINLYNFMFYLLYFFIIFYYMCGRINGVSIIRNIINIIIPFGLIFIIIIQSKKYSKKSLLICLSIIMVVFFSYLISHNKDLLITTLFIIASKNIEVDKLIKYDMVVKLILMF